MMPEFLFSLGNKADYSISAKDFLVGKENGTCQIKVYNSGDRFVLGEIFLKKMYMIYDSDYARIGLGPILTNAVSPDSNIIPDLVDPDSPINDAQEEQTHGATYIILGLICVVSVLAGVAVCAY